MFLILQARRQPHVLPIKLPLSGAIPPPPRAMAVHTVGMDRAGLPTLDGRALNFPALESWLTTQAGSPHPLGIIFDPDPDSRYGDALPLLAALWRHGFTYGPFCFGRLADYRYFDTDRRVRPLRLTTAEPTDRLAIPRQRAADAACDRRRQHGPMDY